MPLRGGHDLGPRMRARPCRRCCAAAATRSRPTARTPSSPTCTRTQRSPSKSSLVTLCSRSTWPPSLLDVVGHRLPHLAGAVAGVVELRDERLDLVALVAEERGLRGAEEGQALDALGRPVGADLRRGHAPDLLGVGLEELVEEPAAEAVRRPTARRCPPCPWASPAPTGRRGAPWSGRPGRAS